MKYAIPASSRPAAANISTSTLDEAAPEEEAADLPAVVGVFASSAPPPVRFEKAPEDAGFSLEEPVLGTLEPPAAFCAAAFFRAS